MLSLYILFFFNLIKTKAMHQNVCGVLNSQTKTWSIISVEDVAYLRQWQLLAEIL